MESLLRNILARVTTRGQLPPSFKKLISMHLKRLAPAIDQGIRQRDYEKDLR